MYHPLPREEARRLLGFSRAIDDDAFIVGNVNRNQPRKRLDLTVQYFAEWVHLNRLPPDVYLYLHCAQRDSGWDLAQLARYYGVENRIMLPPPNVVSAAMGFPETEMALVYSSFDVQLTTTAGEGWGLPQIEGMACGIPQIMPQYSALGEWAAGAAYYVTCPTSETHTGINTIGGIPDKQETINALQRMYSDADLRKRYGQMALARAREPQFRWEKVADLFKCHLGKMLIDNRQAVADRAEIREKEKKNGKVQETGSVSDSDKAA